MLQSKIDLSVFRALAVVLFGLATLSACGGASQPGSIAVSSRDFVLLPCGSEVPAPCTLAIAGGKRVLLGAPSGAEVMMSDDDLRQIDAVLLFSLRARDVEGLDTVRNRSWQAGRREPLLVIGPAGTAEFVDGLNTAFEVTDSLLIVDEGMPAGGFDAAVLAGTDLPLSGEWAVAFDTGDFRVQARDLGNGRVQARLFYQDQVDLVGLCEAWLADVGSSHDAELPLGCPDSDVSTWPMRAPIWFVRAGN